MSAQFTLPLQTVIPGQLIASSLWNGEWQNLNTNFIPAGMDSYSDTDTQMQIQTAPYPGSVTSHASNLGGEIERIRYQISALIGGTYWYEAPAASVSTLNDISVPVGGVVDYPSSSAPNSNWHLADGTAISRTLYSVLYSLIGTTFGVGDGSTTFNLPDYTDRMSIAAGNLYALADTGGAVSSTPSVSITDPGHTHTQNSHTHTMANHTHSTPNHTHTLADGGASGFNAGTGKIVKDTGSGNLRQTTSGGNVQEASYTTNSGGSGTSGTPSTNTSDAATATNNSNTTGISASLGSGISSLPPYLGMFKMIRVS